MKFRNPSNNYQERGGDILSWLWCLMFGPIWLVYRGAYGHALIWFLLFAPTCGLIMFAYPFFAASIADKYYLRRGWIPV